METFFSSEITAQNIMAKKRNAPRIKEILVNSRNNVFPGPVNKSRVSNLNE